MAGAGRRTPTEPAPIDDERLAPILQAITTAADAEAITVTLSPLATEPFGRRAQRARLTFEIAAPAANGLETLIASASAAASADGLVVEVAGVRYDPADCAALEEAAEQAAIAEARLRAERLARLLEVTLGDVVSATSDVFALAEEDGCGGQEGYSYESQHGGLGISVPVFDPSLPAEVTATAHLAIGYAIVPDGSG